MKTTFNHEFSVGEEVYFFNVIQGDALKGKILDVQYILLSKKVEYLICWSPNEFSWISEECLTLDNPGLY